MEWNGIESELSSRIEGIGVPSFPNEWNGMEWNPNYLQKLKVSGFPRSLEKHRRAKEGNREKEKIQQIEKDGKNHRKVLQ